MAHAGAATLTTVLAFDNHDGAAPEDGPIAVNGQLFGTTVLGGSASSGTIFQLDPTTGTETVLYNFQGGTDGWEPQAGLVYHRGELFGTTDWGGNTGCLNQVGCGTVFRFNIKTGKHVVLYTFSGGSDGGTPTPGNLVYLNGKLYGTTWGGGASGLGTVYSVDAKTGNETVLHSFAGGTDGAYPQSGLTYANGLLYGQAFTGGNNGCVGSFGTGCGIVFAMDPTTGAETILHVFGNTPDGALPWGNLAYENGALYGATYSGGDKYGDGTIFSVDVATGTESVLYTFSGTDGSLGDGVIYHNGHLYGSTLNGGPCQGGCYNYGDVFQYDLATGKEKVLFTFSNDGNGGLPYGRLLYSNRALYGTTMQAGATCSCGTLFKIKP